MNISHPTGAYGRDQADAGLTYGSPAGAAFLCRVSEAAIRAAVESGAVRTARRGSRLLVCIEDVERLGGPPEPSLP
jgi:hypothetical protein